MGLRFPGWAGPLSGGWASCEVDPCAVGGARLGHGLGVAGTREEGVGFPDGGTPQGRPPARSCD